MAGTLESLLSKSGSKSLLATLSQRQPVALAFQQDRPYDTLASFGPALATEGANMSNNALGRLLHRQQLDSDQSVANTEARTKRFEAILGNLDKLTPGVRATAMGGNPELLMALGLGNLPPNVMQELLASGAGMEAALAGAEGMNNLGSGVDKLRQGGVHTSVPGIGNLLESLGGDPTGFMSGTPSGAETANALGGKTVQERTGIGPDGRTVTIREEDERPSRAGQQAGTGTGTLPSGAAAPTSFNGRPVRVIVRDGAPVVQMLDPRTNQVTHELSPGAYQELQEAFGNAQ